MSGSNTADDQVTLVDDAVAEGGAYEIIRQRLLEQGQQLKTEIDTLNAARLDEFGSTDLDVVARIRVRTENNSIARDIVQIGNTILFGYNVFIGLKKETKIEDVFSLFSCQEEGGDYALEPVPHDNNFLYESGFKNDFDELYRYYKNTKLIQLAVKNGKLLAAFQIGERLEDVRVFRWSISADNKTVTYIDNRGERDIQLPNPYDFEWVDTQREDVVQGRHAHINILDTIFVDTLGGNLTLKIENNTEDGLGIYNEPVDDATQSLDDADVSFAKIGELILLRIKPYREERYRYFIYNMLTETAQRIDEIGESCIQLPEDHGVIFPGGFYLQTGETKSYDEAISGFRFKRMIRSPNGEDALFVFYEPQEGQVALLSYNLIDKSLRNPILGHGYALFDDGRIVIFTAEDEPARVHPMQIWQSPYVSLEYASQQPESQSFYGRIGNAELVRGISDLYSIHRIIKNQSVSLKLYEELSNTAHKVFDSHYWLSEQECQGVSQLLKHIEKTSELVIDEFEKVESIRQQSAKAMQEVETTQEKLLSTARFNEWETIEGYVDVLSQLRQHRGRLVTLKEYRYINQDRLDELDDEVISITQELNQKTVDFLSGPIALEPYDERIQTLDTEAEKATTTLELEPILEQIHSLASGLDVLSELMATLTVADANVRTHIIDAISEIYAKLNQGKARIQNKKKSMGSAEAHAQFSAQFKLFSQSINNALGQATTPDRCDEQHARLLVQLEEFESQFSEIDEFLADIMAKRDEVHEAFESHKQQLLDEQQRKASAVSDAAERILSSIEKRSLKFTALDELNTYFASDVLVAKSRDMVMRLRDLNAAVKADDIEAKFKAIKEQAIRALRDKSDIFEDGGKVIKLGPRHRFSVNQQELDLTLIPREGQLNLHLSGTNFFEVAEHKALNELKAYWDITLISETPQIYRSEYLAYLIIQSARKNKEGLSLKTLSNAVKTSAVRKSSVKNNAGKDNADLQELIKTFASPRYKEGYEKGVHDHDAACILKAVVPAMLQAETLSYEPSARALAQLYWHSAQQPLANHQVDKKQIDNKQKETWLAQARSAKHLRELFGSLQATHLLKEELLTALNEFVEQADLSFDKATCDVAADYLVAELERDNFAFAITHYAQKLLESLQSAVDTVVWEEYQRMLLSMQDDMASAFALGRAWLAAFIEKRGASASDENTALNVLAPYIDEAASILCTPNLERRYLTVKLDVSVTGLLGQHIRIKEQTLFISLHRYLKDLHYHTSVKVPGYQKYLAVRAEVMSQEREKFRLDDFKARPLSSFVRNRLINESYLPLIGDNLAKQMGTVGEDKRSDLMGLLMMISPPGYGKTTLMEYVASRLGLIFMKINCPSLGHDVVSLDPEQASNATAAQELVKLNLALEMGNNVMLYLDDIQHTDPEFLQKFISLCDGTRRIEGVWRGKSKTYDMRGRKFCVVMAGNPYTESGDVFKVPDMLANRADIYNLGDILGGTEEQFAMSYIENSLTSNKVLAPLALRSLDDVYKLIARAQGENIAATDLSYAYSGAEINEICDVLKKMFVVRDVILKVNQQYIASAAQNDNYRTEPPFKLQGSYRNMNKMAEKISAVMTQEELMAMIDDHYQGESQLLTSGSEDNLLKLAELRGNMTSAEQVRWAEIKKDFTLHKEQDSGIDGTTRIAQNITEMTESLEGLGNRLSQQEDQRSEKASQSLMSMSQQLQNTLQTFLQKTEQQSLLSKQSPVKVELDATLFDGIGHIAENIATTLEASANQLTQSVEKSIDFDIAIVKRITKLSADLKAFAKDHQSEIRKGDDLEELRVDDEP